MEDDSIQQDNGGIRVNPQSPKEAIQPKPVAAPRRSKRAKSGFVTALSGIFTFLVLLGVGAGIGLYIGKSEFEAPGPLERSRTVLIPRGQGVEGIANALQASGVIDQAYLFVAATAILKANKDLKAGEYLFEEHVSMRDVLDIIRSGKGISHQITFPEGLTSEQIVARLMEDPVLTGDIAEIPAEGSLLPETYKYERGSTRAEVIKRMQAAHQRVVDEAWNRRAADLPINSPEEMVILASIVEKETGIADERPRVAGVFINRLRKNMRLQSDPTIIYGIVGGKGKLGRPILRSEIDTPTAYNTYQINGLPPTPIANPGKDAIEAVANPSRTEELYFVADGTGGHIFAGSLEEHNRNVARWREIAKKRRAEAEERAAAEAEAQAEQSADQDSAANVEGGSENPGGSNSLRGLNTATPN